MSATQTRIARERSGSVRKSREPAPIKPYVELVIDARRLDELNHLINKLGSERDLLKGDLLDQLTRGKFTFVDFDTTVGKRLILETPTERDCNIDAFLNLVHEQGEHDDDEVNACIAPAYVRIQKAEKLLGVEEVAKITTTTPGNPRLKIIDIALSEQIGFG